MGKREDLLAYIERMKAEDETAKTYGDDWKRRDWKTRQSLKAGELCLTVGALTQAEAKAKRRPGSIGARKAKQKAKAYRRKLKRLETILAESYSDYEEATNTPQYIEPLPYGEPDYDYSQKPQRPAILKDGGKDSYYVD